MIKVQCAQCKQELDEPGWLLISPPTDDGACTKFHICVDCMTTDRPALEADFRRLVAQCAQTDVKARQLLDRADVVLGRLNR